MLCHVVETSSERRGRWVPPRVMAASGAPGGSYRSSIGTGAIQNASLVQQFENTVQVIHYQMSYAPAWAAG